ncbi:hypothetical protein CFP56_021089 [Quercus suber]|uniref:Uncharacterized protein n=1 Tax=Quercus suber TaxID=58331 RepID=A0AAW0KE74_QUESU
MFGETEYDPTRQFSSVDIEEQLDALSRAIDAGKNSYNLLCRTFDSGMAKCCHHESGLEGLWISGGSCDLGVVGYDFGRSWVCSPWVSRGFTRRGSVVLVVCSSWVSRGFASRGSVVGLLAMDQWCSSFARRGSVVGLLAVGQSWVCSPWISGARRGFARPGSVVLIVCSPWVKRGFARRGCVVGLLAVGLGLLTVGLSWVCSSWVWVLFTVG